MELNNEIELIESRLWFVTKKVENIITVFILEKLLIANENASKRRRGSNGEFCGLREDNL